MAVCRECGREKDVDWAGWCDDCLSDLERYVEDREK
jgi:NMD protein affecting ribosome stability and mRNA decay